MTDRLKIEPFRSTPRRDGSARGAGPRRILSNRDVEPAPVRRAGDVPRDRSCLKCGETFASEWSGERICGRCQSRNEWKRGWG